jgi:hypothetical protein
MIAMNSLRLPRVDEPPPNLALMVLGKALAQAYLEPINQPLPPALARIVREIEEREADAGALNGLPPNSNGPSSGRS